MRGGKKVAIVLASALLLWAPWCVQESTSAEAAESDPADDLSPEAAAAWIREKGPRGDFVLLDVRTPEEYRDGHIAGALLIDYRSPSFKDDLGRLDRGKTYLVYCRTGNRSGKAVSLMEELRFRKVHHLSGGILKWKEAGFPTVR